MSRIWTRVRAAWQALWRGGDLDAAMHEEMRVHIEMEAERLVRERGLDPQEARRQAHVAFGGVEKYKEAGRDVRGLRWLDHVSLDTRLGVRMLIKHRGLTVVGGFAMAVAIAIGATCFEIFAQLLNPVLPVEDGARVVALQYATPVPGSPERRVLHDFVAWRDELESIEEVGAYRTAEHELVSAKAPQEPIAVAEITAAGLAVARTPPLLGRYLLPEDERDGAPPVVVIGHRPWRSRFAGDPEIVGRTMNLDGTVFTIVGVMPEGFRFPVDHQYWIPLRENPLQYARLQGPALFVFGRLAPRVTQAEAQAELTIVGQRTAAAHPATHKELRPIVLPYTYEHFGITDPFRMWAMRVAQVLLSVLMVVVAANLAILVYARTVTRLGEIAVRSALGAGRRRILAQLFMESLALSMVGAGVGLGLAYLALGRLRSIVLPFVLPQGGLPFWVDLQLSAGTVVYACGLAVVAALIMGVVPGLQVTRRLAINNVRDLDGRTGTRLGAVWSTLIVSQIAVAVALLPMAVYLAWTVVRMGIAAPSFAAEQFLVGTVAVNGEAAAIDPQRLGGRQLELMARLQAEPGVSAVTFSSGVPGFASGRTLRFDDAARVKEPHDDLEVDTTLEVGLDLFDTYGARILAGRRFDAADLGATNAVIVNRAFVQEYMDGSPGTALGAGFRYVAEEPSASAETAYQIVGVVDDFPRFPPEPGKDGEPTIYHPAAAGEVHPLTLTVRFNGSIPDGFAERVRAIGVEVDPAFNWRRIEPLSNYYAQLRSLWRSLAWGAGLVTTSVLLLSAAGIYALMSFTVAQRTREIAIRTALGAHPYRLVLAIFGRASRQIAVGLAVGAILSAGVFQHTAFTAGRAAALTLTVAAIIVVIGLLAAFGPAQRSLRIQASEALRADA